MEKISFNIVFAELDKFGLDTEAGNPKGVWLSDWPNCCCGGAAETIGPNMSSILLVSGKFIEHIPSMNFVVY